MDKFERLQQFMDSTEEHLYPEPPAEPQISITTQMVDLIAKLDFTSKGKKLLDVGCGQGLALELFQAAGLDVTGVTLGEEDVKVCQEKGLDVRRMDQSFLEFGDGEFDLIWSRHALEHSFFPMFTLWGFHRVLKEGGCSMWRSPPRIPIVTTRATATTTAFWEKACG